MRRKLICGRGGVDILIELRRSEEKPERLDIFRDIYCLDSCGLGEKANSMVYTRAWGWRAAAGIYVLNHSLKMVDRNAVVKVYTNSKGVFTVLGYRNAQNIPANFDFADYATALFKTLKGRKVTVLPLFS